MLRFAAAILFMLALLVVAIQVNGRAKPWPAPWNVSKIGGQP